MQLYYNLKKLKYLRRIAKTKTNGVSYKMF